MEWYSSAIVLQLIEYMEARGCQVITMVHDNIPINLDFHYGEQRNLILGVDIQEALDYAYRVEWHPGLIARSFERKLIFLNAKRKYDEKEPVEA